MECAEAAAAEGMGRGLYGVAMGGAGLVGVLQALVVLVMLLIPYSPQSKQVFVTLRKSSLGHFRTSREAALIFGFSLFGLIVMTGIYHQLHRSIHLEHKLSRQRISLQRTTAQALTQERALAQLRLSLQQHEQTARNQQQEASRATKSSEAVVRQAQAQQREYLRLWEEKEQLQRQLDRLILEQSERKDGRAKKND